VIEKFWREFLSLVSVANQYYRRKVKRSFMVLGFSQSILLISILTTGLVLGVKQLGWLEFLELVTFDQMVRLKGDAPLDPRLLVVRITEADIQNQGTWPITDRAIAQLLKKLQQYHPRVIGLDIYRNLSQPPGLTELRQQLHMDNVISIYKLVNKGGEGVSPIPGLPPEQISFNDILVDNDDIVRRNLLYAFQGKDKFYSFSLRLSLKYLAKQGILLKVQPDALQLGQTTFPALAPDTSGYHNLDALGYQIMVSYRSSEHIAEEISFTQVLRGQFDPSLVKDKIVIIGTDAPSHNDLFFTPYSAGKSANPGMNGVFVHAEFVSQILSTTLDQKPLFWFWSKWEEILWIWLFALLGGVLVWRISHPLLLRVANIAAMIGLYAICFGIFTHGGWIPLIPPFLGLIAAGGTALAYKIIYNSLHDTLTGLPNKELFLQHLEWAIAETKFGKNKQLALLFLDIDRFEFINETFNHQVGDQILIGLTQRLKAYLAAQGTLARVGGEEFAILLENIADTNKVKYIADELQKKIALPFKHQGQEIFITISIGIAFNQSELDYEPVTLLRDAHTAMYRARDLGKGRYEVFATSMYNQVFQRFQLETGLRRGIEKEEFYLNYQPIVCLKTERIVGFEALVRWRNTEHGFISPGEFIPVAEDTELILPLGKWVLAEACAQLSVWQNQFPTDPPLMMSINLSGKQLSQPDLVESIQQILTVTNLNGKSVKLEITETVAMKDVEAAINVLLRLRTLNLRLSIDDFGTGYSSLSYLHRFPVNTLKVDQSFVRRMENTTEDGAIVETIIILGHALGMDVIAEGVETIAQKNKLKSLGCEYGQGYLFAKPLHQDQATALLESQFTSTIIQ